MGYINYTPTHKLVGGGSDGKLHPEFQRYTLEPRSKVKQTESLDGSNVETTFYSDVDFIRVQSDLVSIADWPKWEEFRASAARGAIFTLDSGTEAAPNNAISVRLVPGSWRFNQTSGRYGIFSFKARVV